MRRTNKNRIGANDPCSCGSGKKFKRCCSGKTQKTCEYDGSSVPQRVLPRVESERVDLAIETNSGRFKIAQVLFGRNGSIFVNTPYFQERTGILSSVTVRPNGTGHREVSLTECGKVASHLVKYSHPPGGMAHFSQTGKISSVIRRQAVSLDKHDGHLFTIMVSGLEAFKAMDSKGGMHWTHELLDTLLEFKLTHVLGERQR